MCSLPNNSVVEACRTHDRDPFCQYLFFAIYLFIYAISYSQSEQRKDGMTLNLAIMRMHIDCVGHSSFYGMRYTICIEYPICHLARLDTEKLRLLMGYSILLIIQNISPFLIG